MNLINKIKLIWQGRRIATSLIDIKSKWKEPTFWAALLANVAGFIAAYKGMVPQEYAKWVIVGQSVLTALYNYVRGMQKAQSDGVKPYNSTSEFLLGLATMINGALIDMQTGGISTPYLAGSSVLITHAIAAGRDLANMRPKEVEAAGAADVPAK